MYKFDIDLFKEYNCTLNKPDNEYILAFDKALGYIYTDGNVSDLGGVDWRNQKYIVIDVTNNNEWVFGLTLGFWKHTNKTDKPDLTVTMGLMPHIRTTLSFDLTNLNSQTMFLPRTPGKLKTVVFGEKLSLNEIGRFSVGTDKCFEKQDITIHGLNMADTEPDYPLPDTILVDEMGQNMTKDWPGKTKDVDELTQYLVGEYNASKNIKPFSDEWDEYGGWKGRRFEKTGFFRTQFDGVRWHLVDPEGYDFYSIGLDCVNPGESGRVDGIEKFFKWLPDDEKFIDAWNKRNKSDKAKFYNFPVSNLIRAFGDKWRDRWADITKYRMNKWGFNTVGNWSDVDFAHYAKIPYVYPLSDFPTTGRKIFRDFPDVFDPEYEKSAERFAQQIKPFLDDKYLIGYFLRNEPQWAFLGTLNIASELLECEGDYASKDALIDYLMKKYNGNINEFNKAWNVNLSSFDDLHKVIKGAVNLSDASKSDLEDFSRIMIERYVSIPSKAVKKIDKNHLNLGMRYAYISNEALLAGYENFDVFSINCYKFDPTDDINLVGQKTNLPVMIGEYHFGSLESGLWATGLKAVTSQKERGNAYKYYMENAASNKYSVGCHYFILNDQALLGRFDGENFQIGVVDCCLKPYDDFVKGIIETNKEIYKVMNGMIDKYDVYPDEMERVGF